MVFWLFQSLKLQLNYKSYTENYVLTTCRKCVENAYVFHCFSLIFNYEAVPVRMPVIESCLLVVISLARIYKAYITMLPHYELAKGKRVSYLLRLRSNGLHMWNWFGFSETPQRLFWTVSKVANGSILCMFLNKKHTYVVTTSLFDSINLVLLFFTCHPNELRNLSEMLIMNLICMFLIFLLFFLYM